jgi:hypothetical protein
LQPRRTARRYLRVRGAARADSRMSGIGLAPRPQALHMPAPLVECMHFRVYFGPKAGG